MQRHDHGDHEPDDEHTQDAGADSDHAVQLRSMPSAFFLHAPSLVSLELLGEGLRFNVLVIALAPLEDRFAEDVVKELVTWLLPHLRRAPEHARLVETLERGIQ